MTHIYTRLAPILFSGTVFLASPAAAQCPLPNVIINGEVADATEIMENFDAIAACTDGTIKQSGIPEAGNIAVFTDEESITSGDLTGDVSTSGDTVTALALTGVTPGTYVNATVTVDEKGRLTAASNGWIGGGSGVWNLVQVETFSNVGSIDLEGFTGSGFSEVQVVLSVQVATGGSGIHTTLKQAGSYVTSGYHYSNTRRSSSGSADSSAHTNASAMIVGPADSGNWSIGNNPGETASLVINLYDPDNAGFRPLLYGTATWHAGSGSGNVVQGTLSGGPSNIGSVEGIRFAGSSGNISGVARVYGR